jgi:hypothetical protein
VLVPVLRIERCSLAAVGGCVHVCGEVEEARAGCGIRGKEVRAMMKMEIYTKGARAMPGLSIVYGPVLLCCGFAASK